MLKLKKIRIYGFKAENRVAEATFSDENVSVVYGPNGCGKTTFLKILHGILSQEESALIQNSVESVELTIRIDNEDIALVVKRGDEEKYDWGEIVSSPLGDTTSLSLGVDRGITNLAVSSDPAFITEFFRHPRRRNYISSEYSVAEISEELSFFLRRSSARNRSRANKIDYDRSHLYIQNIKIDNIEELLTERYRTARLIASRKIQSALFDTLSVAISLDEKPTIQEELPDDFDKRLKDNKARIREALDDGSENQFKYKVIEILDSISKDDEVEKVRQHPILSQLFLNIIEELEMEKLILSSINLLVDTFNHYLIDDKKLVVNGREAFVEVDGSAHGINELSSGERHILTFLSLVLFGGEHRNFLIIDEPEISLNIEWQRELMSLFSELVPSTQIIVASHSPALVKGNQNYLTELKTSVIK